ncbi:Rap family tetratricopeptide repeat protein [Bacillus gaemokensis]|uniref:Aspartate phosphatase n=1 Tax=Bacillus gaemokensis TaxID=574375 RepID=A0A073KJZ6_9BACI|nr:Rap family tetratricopeptide repeat protein [Bacillus gaemokensis]KEK22653.1 aspartate phosphatase [Bacillus gaemokensis]KYG28923.1 aspartate phosphatase [Bacillus gaemokensis]
MGATTVTLSEITGLLNKWHDSIRSQNLDISQELYNEVKIKIENIQENQNILLYYSLLEFRFNMLNKDYENSNTLLKKIETFNKPSEELLNYYYYFFKAIHATETGQYNDADSYFNQAKGLLDNIPDEIEKAEFYYKSAAFYYQVRRPLIAVKYANRAKKYFETKSGYEINVASCSNILGLTCTSLKQYETAEEYFHDAINIVTKQRNTILGLKVRHNLGFLYAEQNHSEAAIRNLSNAIDTPEKSFKAIFLLARENYKLGNTEETSKLINTGLDVCKRISNTEYKHHFLILNALNTSESTEKFENIISEGIQYFEREGLLGFVHDYSKQLALKFYSSNQPDKASLYFYKSHKAEEKLQEKEALK